MLDGLRSTDTGTPKARQKMHHVEIAINQLCHRNGRMPAESQVAEALDIDTDDYQRLLQKVSGYPLFSLSDFDEEKEGRNSEVPLRRRIFHAGNQRKNGD